MARVLIQDVLPYDLPSSWAALDGPQIGTLTLPHWVHWGPHPQIDLVERADLIAAYQAIVREGSPEVQEETLNRDLLRAVWSALNLPTRCRSLWEQQFPELTAIAASPAR